MIIKEEWRKSESLWSIILRLTSSKRPVRFWIKPCRSIYTLSSFKNKPGSKPFLLPPKSTVCSTKKSQIFSNHYSRSNFSRLRNPIMLTIKRTCFIRVDSGMMTYILLRQTVSWCRSWRVLVSKLHLSSRKKPSINLRYASWRIHHSIS